MAGDASGEGRGVTGKLIKRDDLLPPAMAVLILIVAYLCGSAMFPGFGSTRSALDLLRANAWLGIAAAGATFVILSGGIDLSAGSMIAFVSVLVAVLVERWHVPPALALVIGLLVGAGAGTVMGSLIHVFKLPAFMVTLAGLFFLRSSAFALSEWTSPGRVAESIGIRNATVLDWASSGIRFGKPYGTLSLQAIGLLAVFVALIILAHRTRFGRNVYAIGGDEQAARLMGVPVGRTKILIYALSGCCAALAGIASTLNKGSGDPASFVGAELDVITAVVIGGTLLRGGSGYLIGTLCGTLVIGVIQSLIDFQGTLAGAWPRIITGGMLLAAILSQRALGRFTGRGAGSDAG